MKILLDHVHAFGPDIRTAPGGSLNEIQVTRSIANSVCLALRQTALDTSLLVPEDRCVSLNSKITRLLRYARRYGESNILLTVIATGAPVPSRTAAATAGWSVVRCSSSPQSRRLADSLTRTALEELGPDALAAVPSHPDYHLLSTLPLITAVPCPAVITSNLSLSTQQDIKKLSTPKGRQPIVNLHVNGILDYLAVT